jgi:hypothetical protein
MYPVTASRITITRSRTHFGIALKIARTTAMTMIAAIPL